MTGLTDRSLRLAALLLPLVLAACSSTPDWMKPGRWFAAEVPAAAADGPYPELSDIPATRPDATPAEQRAATVESLAGERARADAAERAVDAIESADPASPAAPSAKPGGS